MKLRSLFERLARRRHHVGALVALATIALTTVFAYAGSAENIIPDPGWTVEATTGTSHLIDGQRLIINIKSRSDLAVNAVQIRECRSGVSYTTESDVNPDSKKCPPRPVSSSADYFVTRGASDGLTTLARSDDGAKIPFLVGQGVVDWNDAQGTRLTCDPTHPCTLVVMLTVGADVVFKTLTLSFTDSDPIRACGGGAPGILNTGGSDELSDAWGSWTRAQCTRTKKGAPTTASFTDESAAVTQFASGVLDLAYTAAGYDSDVALTALDPAQRRKAIAIPIALNASVIAAGGGQHQITPGLPPGDKVPYADGSLQLTAGEVGALLGGGQQWIQRIDLPYGQAILTRNPVLRDILYAADNGLYAPSRTLASTYFMTDYLATLAPADFVRPTVVPAAAHGPVSSLALSTPPFSEINLYTGRPLLAKVMVPASFSATDGPIWSMTDLASARALGLTPVALTGAGGFVAPTPASMAAAVPTMKENADGFLLPDPAAATAAAAPAAGEAPYPLTYVEYALVPAERLYNPFTCELRPDSQALLAEWLDYVTGPGQTNLPRGLQPLPASLLATAKSRLAQVGDLPVSGRCAGHGGGTTTTTTTTPTTRPSSTTVPTTPSSVNGGGPGAGGFTSGGGLPTGSPGIDPATGLPLPPGTRAVKPIAAVDIPGFAGHRLPGSTRGALALLGIAVLMSLAAWITAGGKFGPVTTARWINALTPRRIGVLIGVWVGVAVMAVALVLFALGPMLQQRDQRSLLSRYKVMVQHAANEALSPVGGISVPTKAPKSGTPVGIIEIGALKSQAVVVEGVQSANTRKGPGHVPGTAGLGQQGNSTLLARRDGYGGAFEHIGELRRGARIVVTTLQGQSLYKVAGVHKIDANIERVYEASSDNRLTLVTSAGGAPWQRSEAIEVTAKLVTTPFAPTPQGTLTAGESGLHADPGVTPTLILVLLAFGAVVAGSVALYRRLGFRTAYVLSIAPLVALTLVAAETATRFLPAWT